MNSRDAAYDEEEQLRLAIEQSKGQGPDEVAEKRGKRSRSDSEEYVLLSWAITAYAIAFSEVVYSIVQLLTHASSESNARQSDYEQPLVRRRIHRTLIPLAVRRTPTLMKAHFRTKIEIILAGYGRSEEPRRKPSERRSSARGRPSDRKLGQKQLGGAREELSADGEMVRTSMLQLPSSCY
jgi:hypothetical protein